MPPTDPRYLAADDDMIMRDLLVIRYQRYQSTRAMNPNIDAEDAARSSSAREKLLEFRDALVATPGYLEKVARGIRNSRKRTSDPSPQAKITALKLATKEPLNE